MKRWGILIAMAVMLACVSTAGATQPKGGGTGWHMRFNVGFGGTSLNTNKTVALTGVQNVAENYPSNVTVSGGHMNLELASQMSGAQVSTAPANGAKNGYLVPVGGFVQSRIWFAGSGPTIYNWPAFWMDGPHWPLDGENDIAEGLAVLTYGYHYELNGVEASTPPPWGGVEVPGNWGGSWHTYGLYRGANSCTVFYDGHAIDTYPTDDPGVGMRILFTMDSDYWSGPVGPAVYGPASIMKVDYVRAWTK